MIYVKLESNLNEIKNPNIFYGNFNLIFGVCCPLKGHTHFNKPAAFRFV